MGEWGSWPVKVLARITSQSGNWREQRGQLAFIYGLLCCRGHVRSLIVSGAGIVDENYLIPSRESLALSSRRKKQPGQNTTGSGDLSHITPSRSYKVPFASSLRQWHVWSVG